MNTCRGRKICTGRSKPSIAKGRSLFGFNTIHITVQNYLLVEHNGKFCPTLIIQPWVTVNKSGIKVRPLYCLQKRDLKKTSSLFTMPQEKVRITSKKVGL